MKSFEQKYPNISAWVLDGQIEVGYGEYDDMFMRVIDPGGVIWESNVKYESMDEAFAAMDKAIADWCKKEGVDLIDVNE